MSDLVFADFVDLMRYIDANAIESTPLPNWIHGDDRGTCDCDGCVVGAAAVTELEARLP